MRGERKNSRDRSGRVLFPIFILGVGASLLLMAHSQMMGDQLNLLARGWLLAVEGVWIQFGNPTSSGGVAPGGVTSLLVGLPLFFWQHHRAPILVVWVFHLLAYLLFDGLIRRCLGRRERILFAILYWLNPWRLFLSGFLWNPNYLLFFASVHAWTSFQQRHRPVYMHSFLHVLAIGIAFQIHASSVLLGAASVLLFFRGYMKVHWPGVITGALVSTLTLVPWALEVWNEPSILPISKGFPGRGLVLVYPLLRGVHYWLRLSSLFLSRKVIRLDFTESLGEEADSFLVPVVFLFTRVVMPSTIVFPLLANVRLWRREWRSRSFSRFEPGHSDRMWLKGFVQWSFVASLLVFCLAPTTIMWWQCAIFLPVTVIPMVLWGGALLRSRFRVPVRKVVWGYGTLSLLVALALAFGGQQFRCGGDPKTGIRLLHDHPMFHELHLVDSCPYSLNDPDGWWPDILPPGGNRKGDG